MAFRPIDIKMGPDGAIYIADWYNPIIQHGEVDFRDPRRDHTRGRIWRVTAKGRPLVPRPKLVGATTEDAARRPQGPRGLDPPAGQAGAEGAGRRRWLRRAGGLGRQARPPAIPSRAPSPGGALDLPGPRPSPSRSCSGAAPIRPTRASAPRPCGSCRTGRTGCPIRVALLGERVVDEHPRVRLEAVRGLAEFPSLRAADLALRGARPAGRHVPGIRPLADGPPARARTGCRRSRRAGSISAAGRSGWSSPCEAVDSPAIVKPLLALLRGGQGPERSGRERPDADRDAGWPRRPGRGAGPGARTADRCPSRDGSALLDHARAGRPATARLSRRATCRGSCRCWPAATTRCASRGAARGRGLERPGAPGHGSPSWRRASIPRPRSGPRPSRRWRSNGKAEGRRAIEALAEHGASAEVQAMALAALLEARSEAADAPRSPAGSAGSRPIEPATPPIVLGPRSGAPRRARRSLAAALEQWPTALPADLAKLCIRQVRASGRDEPAPDRRARKGRPARDAATRTLDGPEMTQLLADVARVGDPARGEAIFRRKDLNCQKCHAIAGAGGQVGPGLESIGASAQPDYLVDSLLEPNKQVKENYHAMAVATDDGKVYTGIKLRQTDSELVLRDAEDREVSIPAQFDRRAEDGRLAHAGGPGRQLDPRRAGRPGPVPLASWARSGHYAVGTRARLPPLAGPRAVSEGRDALARGGPEAVLTIDNPLIWRPAYTTVAGLLPLSEWAGYGRSPNRRPSALARTQLQVTTAGKVKLAFNSTEGLRFWIRRPARRAGTRFRRTSLVLDLTPGLHTLGVAVDLAHRREGIRCILDDVPGSPARAQVVLGK